MSKIERHLPKILATVGILLLAGIVVQVIASLPPRSLTMLSGRQGGAYYLGSQLYQKVAAQDGFEINIVETAGSSEALQMLKEGKGDVAFIQGGIATAADADKLAAIATVGYEPVWIMYRRELAPEATLDSPVALTGRRIGVGERGSGTNPLARLLLGDFGVTEENTTFVELSTSNAIAALRSGELDAAVFVLNPTAPVLQEIIQDRSLELMNLKDAEALARRHRFLSVLSLPKGTISLVDDVPRTNLKLVAPSVNLVIRNNLHPDLIRMLAFTAVELHSPGGFFSERNEFPNTQNTDLPVSKQGETYLQRIRSGAFMLDRYVPFQIAAMFDRYMLFVLPLLLILLPMLSRSPVLYQIYMRRKVNRWYKDIRKIERRVNLMDVSEIDAAIAELESIDDTLAHEISVSDTYMPNLYDLRTHLDYVVRSLQKRKAQVQAGDAAPPTSAARVTTHEQSVTFPQAQAATQTPSEGDRDRTDRRS